MNVKKMIIPVVLALFIAWTGCGPDKTKDETEDEDTVKVSDIQKRVNEYATVELNADLSVLSEKEKQMLPLLFEAAQIMDDLFWKQAYGDKQELLNSIEDEAAKEFVKINYGPWDRLRGNEPFIEGVGEKPLGANFYPADMDTAKFNAWDNEEKTSLYTLIRRDEKGRLTTIPYHVAYYDEGLSKAAALLAEASNLAEDEGLKKYLRLRSEALLNDEYLDSDLAWMDMKENTIDFIVGPIENYEDALYGYKAAYEAFILIKDKEWSEKLARFAGMLPELQKSLPVDDKYKQETPGTDSDLNAYDAIYYAGDCNAASKTIAINLPNDERVHTTKGSRKLQLKNAMRAKFDKILVPISELLIAENQRKHIKFDAFFENTMFHEVGHGLGIKQTINDKGTVRKALQKYYSPIEEGKADILGLFLVTKLAEMGELGEKDLMDNYVTFMASIFRSIRFGVASSHGKANMMRFYYFKETGAFNRDPETGTYSVDFDKMKEAMNSLAEKILVIQGDGNLEEAKKWVDAKANINEELQKDLDRISEAGIPRDIVFKQGKDVIGL